MQGETLGARIADAIQLVGSNKNRVATQMNVGWQTVQQWTLDKSAPTVDNLRLLSEVLGVTLDELVGVAVGQEPPFEAWRAFLSTVDGQSITPGERRALQAIYWPPGTEPTVASYMIVLGGIRAVIPRRDPV